MSGPQHLQDSGGPAAAIVHEPEADGSSALPQSVRHIALSAMQADLPALPLQIDQLQPEDSEDFEEVSIPTLRCYNCGIQGEAMSLMR